MDVWMDGWMNGSSVSFRYRKEGWMDEWIGVSLRLDGWISVSLR